MQNLFRITEVVAHHIATVPFGRGGAGTLMQNRLNISGKRRIGFQQAEKIILVDVIDDGQVGDVAEFVAVTQIVDDQDIAAIVFNQHAGKIAADESGPASYDMHDLSRCLRSSIRRRNTDILPGRFLRLEDRLSDENSTNTSPAWDTTAAGLWISPCTCVVHLPESDSARLCLTLLPLNSSLLPQDSAEYNNAAAYRLKEPVIKHLH